MAEVKICGIKTEEALEAAIAGKAAFAGFIFCSGSPRNILPSEAGKFRDEKRIKKVAVTVGAGDSELDSIVKALKPDFLQLHGNETPERAESLKNKYQAGIIKAFKVEGREALAQAREFGDAADFLLFDAKAPGSGVSFDWGVLAGESFGKPWFLAGGLNENNVSEAIRVTKAQFVDISSGVESAPGVKSPELIRRFIKKAHDEN